MNVQSPNDPWNLFWSLGYRRLVPIAPPGAPLAPNSGINPTTLGKVPGIRTEDGWTGLRGWQTREATREDTERWRDMGCGVGIVCGDGLLAIDADTLNEDHAATIANLVKKHIGLTPTRVGQEPKALYLLRCPPKWRQPKVLFAGKSQIDFRTYGQFVAWGIHPKTLRPYRWTHPPLPLDELPEGTTEALAALVADLLAALPEATIGKRKGDAGPAPKQDTLRGGPKWVETAVAALPNDYPDRDDFVDVFYAIKAATTPDEALGLRLALEWAERWTAGENDEEYNRRTFASLRPPYRVGASFLYDHAEKRGKFRRAAMWHDEALDEAPPATPPKDTSGLFGEPTEETLPDLTGTPFEFPEASEIEPEDFLYDTWLVRDYVSLIAAQTKVGKSLFMIAVALSLASGKPLLGVKPDRLMRVRIWNGEDTRKTMTRRILACMKLHGVTREDCGDRLIIDSGRDMPIVVATQTKSGATIHRPIVEALVRSLVRQNVDVLIIDPFVKVHQVSENDNTAIDAVAREWMQVADRAGIGLALVHHSRKLNGAEASIDDARGASALSSAARAALVLARMTKREAKTLGRSKDYKSLFRIADAASNLAIAPGDDERWFEIRSIDLNNARFDPETGALLRKSDRIGAATVSATRGGIDEDEGTTATPAAADHEARALDMLACGLYKRDPRSRDEWAGAPVAIAYGLSLDDADDKARAAAIVTRLVREGKLVEASRPDKNRKMKTFLSVANNNNSLFEDLFG
jgi:hypothetical protein